MEFGLFVSLLINLVQGLALYLIANPLLNKRFRTWLLIRNILDRFNDEISFQEKLPVNLSLKHYDKEIIEKVERKLVLKGFKVSNENNSITIK